MQYLLVVVVICILCDVKTLYIHRLVSVYTARGVEFESKNPWKGRSSKACKIDQGDLINRV